MDLDSSPWGSSSYDSDDEETEDEVMPRPVARSQARVHRDSSSFLDTAGAEQLNMGCIGCSYVGRGPAVGLWIIDPTKDSMIWHVETQKYHCLPARLPSSEDGMPSRVQMKQPIAPNSPPPSFHFHEAIHGFGNDRFDVTREPSMDSVLGQVLSDSMPSDAIDFNAFRSESSDLSEYFPSNSQWDYFHDGVPVKDAVFGGNSSLMNDWDVDGGGDDDVDCEGEDDENTFEYEEGEKEHFFRVMNDYIVFEPSSSGEASNVDGVGLEI